jgi:hypothetical protein
LYFNWFLYGGIVGIRRKVFYPVCFCSDVKKGERDFLADKSTDPLWNAVKLLFPSNNGQLGTTTSATTLL